MFPSFASRVVSKVFEDSSSVNWMSLGFVLGFLLSEVLVSCMSSSKIHIYTRWV
jgi:hypothetical protein